MPPTVPAGGTGKALAPERRINSHAVAAGRHSDHAFPRMRLRQPSGGWTLFPRCKDSAAFPGAHLPGPAPAVSGPAGCGPRRRRRRTGRGCRGLPPSPPVPPPRRQLQASRRPTRSSRTWRMCVRRRGLCWARGSGRAWPLHPAPPDRPRLQHKRAASDFAADMNRLRCADDVFDRVASVEKDGVKYMTAEGGSPRFRSPAAALGMGRATSRKDRSQISSAPSPCGTTGFRGCAAAGIRRSSRSSATAAPASSRGPSTSSGWRSSGVRLPSRAGPAPRRSPAPLCPLASERGTRRRHLPRV